MADKTLPCLSFRRWYYKNEYKNLLQNPVELLDDVLNESIYESINVVVLNDWYDNNYYIFVEYGIVNDLNNDTIIADVYGNEKSYFIKIPIKRLGRLVNIIDKIFDKMHNSKLQNVFKFDSYQFCCWETMFKNKAYAYGFEHYDGSKSSIKNIIEKNLGLDSKKSRKQLLEDCYDVASYMNTIPNDNNYAELIKNHPQISKII